MFEKLRIIFSIPELRKKVLLTIGLLAVYRVGFHVPLPMVATNLGDEGTAAQFFEKISVFAASDLRQATIFGLGIMVAPVIGPALGGYLTETYSWRMVLYINVPIGLVAFTACYAVVHDPDYLTTERAEARK